MKYPSSKIVIVIVLLAVAVSLGYVIYANRSTQLGRPQQPEGPTSRPTGIPQTSTGSNQTPPWLANVTAVEKSLFDIPGPNASEEEKKRHSDLVIKNTSTASELSILRACQPSPLSLSVDSTLSFTVRNRDTVAHTLKIDANKEYALAPGATSTVTLEKKATILGYGCDSYDQVGFLVTAP